MDIRFELKVFVVMISAPASRYCLCIPRMISGFVIDRISVPFPRSGMIPEFLAAEIGFLQFLLLDHGSHGSVEGTKCVVG